MFGHVDTYCVYCDISVQIREHNFSCGTYCTVKELTVNSLTSWQSQNFAVVTEEIGKIGHASVLRVVFVTQFVFAKNLRKFLMALIKSQTYYCFCVILFAANFLNRLCNKTNYMHQFHKFILSWNSTCFGQFVCPSSGVYSLYTQQWYMWYRFVDSFRAGAYAPARKLSTNVYDIYHCWVYSE